MAGLFGVNLDAVDAIAYDLHQIRSDLSGVQHMVVSDTAVTGSATVAEALHRFADDSADQRRRLTALLDNAIARLEGLAQGTRAVDGVLSDSLGPPIPGSPIGPVATRP